MPIMKTWNGLDNAAAPAESPKPPRTQVRWRALAATVVTMAVLTTFPGLKEWSSYLLNDGIPFGGSHSAVKPFQWSEVR